MVKGWPSDKLLRRQNDGLDLYVAVDEDGIAEADWPADLDVKKCTNGMYVTCPTTEEDSGEEVDSSGEDGGGGNDASLTYEQSLADSCELCARIPRDESDVAHCNKGGHSFHKRCLEHWRDCVGDKRACPQCDKFVEDQLRCPVLGCSTPMPGSVMHMRKKHRRVRCKTCKRYYLAHARRSHEALSCASWVVTCPTDRCRIDVSMTVARNGRLDPFALDDDHGCEDLSECGVCGDLFLTANSLLDHARVSCDGVRKRRRRASRKKRRRKLRFSEEDLTAFHELLSEV